MKNTSRGFDTIAGLFLVCVFAAAMLLTLTAGAGIYKDISGVMEEQFTSRTAVGYLTAKLHQSDAQGAVSLGELAGTPAIIVRQELDGEEYATYVYCHDGYIMELFCPAAEELLPSDGQRVVAAQSAEFSLSGRLLRLDIVTDAGAETAYVSLITAREVAA